MGDALKKHLTKMEIEVGDLVVLRPPVTAQEGIYLPFAREVADTLAGMGLGPLIVVPPLADLRVLTQEQLQRLGLVRVIPTIPMGTFFVNWEAYEDEAHQLLRLAFAKAREDFDERAALEAKAEAV